ncbi:hypothetical protein AAVH_21407 [Aphelenchoides avenae]|nr:hypothetical protein AAVH_21407 [Aphelenchus avenae]
MAPQQLPTVSEVAGTTTTDGALSRRRDEQSEDQSSVQQSIDSNNNDSEHNPVFHELANYDPNDCDGYSGEDESEAVLELCEHEELLDDCEECEIAAGEFCKHGGVRIDCEDCEEEALDEICQHGEDRLDCDTCAELRNAELGLCRHDMFVEECGDCEMEQLEEEELEVDECPHGFFREDCDECFEDDASICDHGEVRTACEACLEEDDIEKREAVEELCLSEDDFSDPDVPTSSAKMWERELWRQIRRQARAHRAIKNRDAEKARSSRKRSRFASDDDSEDEVHHKN